MYTMPLVPYSKTLSSQISLATGIPTQSISRIHITDLQTRKLTTERYTYSLPIFLEEIAALQRTAPESEQDPLLVMWRIRGLIRRISSPRITVQQLTDLEQTVYHTKFGSNSHKAMATRAMRLRGSKHDHNRLCDQLLHQIYTRLTRQEALRPLEQSFWLLWYGKFVPTIQKQRDAFHINAYINQRQREDLRP